MNLYCASVSTSVLWVYGSACLTGVSLDLNEPEVNYCVRDTQ